MKTHHVRDLEPMRPAQTLALYRRGDEYIVVSTVNLREGLPSEALDVADTMTLLAGMFGRDLGPTSGEETMAFPADSEGEPHRPMIQIARANGPGSRVKVLEELGADG